jgi:hypothetical protein
LYPTAANSRFPHVLIEPGDLSLRKTCRQLLTGKKAGFRAGFRFLLEISASLSGQSLILMARTNVRVRLTRMIPDNAIAPWFPRCSTNFSRGTNDVLDRRKLGSPAVGK